LHPNVQGKVTIQTSRPVAREALLPTLESVLRIHGAAVVRNEGVYKVVPIAEAPSAGVRPSIDLPPGARGQGFGVQIVPLQYISAREMERILKPVSAQGAILRVDVARNLLLLTGTRQERLNLLDMVNIFDVDWLAGMSVALIPLKAADPKALMEDLQRVFGNNEDGPLAGVVKFQPIERLNSILVITSRSEYLDKAQSWIERLDGGIEGGERALHVYLVQNGRATDLADVLNQIFGDSTSGSKSRRSENRQGRTTRSELGRADGTRSDPKRGTTTPPATTTTSGQSSAAQFIGQAREVNPTSAPPTANATSGQGVVAKADTVRIIADKKNNALIILATTREYRSILAALAKLDIRPLQVLIEATIAEVKLNDELRYGRQWYFKSASSEFTLSNAGTTGPNLTGALPGFSYLLGITDARVVLDALDSVTDFKVISSPQLMVLDNETATLTVGDEVPIATQQSTTTDSNPRTINTIQFRNTGIILTVTPRVNASGLVQLDVSQEASNVVATVTSGIDSPTIRQRKIESSVAIASGQTVALGGLIDERETKISSGLPVLSRIPILGALFGSKTQTGERTEILILITPRIIRNQMDARVATEELRNRVRALIPLDKRIN
jgi:general secretion pathway protein D